jgi:hypothetical protein
MRPTPRRNPHCLTRKEPLATIKRAIYSTTVNETAASAADRILEALLDGHATVLIVELCHQTGEKK